MVIARTCKHDKSTLIFTAIRTTKYELRYFTSFFFSKPKIVKTTVMALSFLTNSADPDQGIHCLLVHVHYFDNLP